MSPSFRGTPDSYVFRYRELAFEFTALPLQSIDLSKGLHQNHTKSGCSFMYLDDWLLVGRSWDETSQNIAVVYTLTRSLGFFVNERNTTSLNPRHQPFWERKLICEGHGRSYTGKCYLPMPLCRSLPVSSSRASTCLAEVVYGQSSRLCAVVPTKNAPSSIAPLSALQTKISPGGRTRSPSPIGGW